MNETGLGDFVNCGFICILLSIAKRMGWVAKRKKVQKTCRLDEAIRASHEDTLFETNDLQTLMESLKS